MSTISNLVGAIVAVLIVIVAIVIVLKNQPATDANNEVIPPKIIIYSQEHFALKDGTPCVVIKYNPQVLTALGISCNYSLQE